MVDHKEKPKLTNDFNSIKKQRSKGKKKTSKSNKGQSKIAEDGIVKEYNGDRESQHLQEQQIYK